MKKNTYFRQAIKACVAGLGLLFSFNGFANASPMEVGRVTTQPIGHYEFCKQVPGECRASRDTGPDRLTQEKWSALAAINARVNNAIEPRTDLEMWGQEEIWSYPVQFGDCEDYALLKRHELAKAGFSLSNLLVTVVLQPNGDGHAVLTVRTDHGDFILDNMVGEVLDWRDTQYRYVKRQASGHAGRWVTINDNRQIVAQR